MSTLQFESQKVALKQDRSGYVMTLRIHPDEVPDELLRDFVGARYMIAMVRLNDDETPKSYENRVKKAGILCKTIRFQEYVVELGYVETTSEESAVAALYEIVGIDSRTQLNGDLEAQKAFDNLVEEYEQWKHKDVPF
jgi:hypothetical protein